MSLQDIVDSDVYLCPGPLGPLQPCQDCEMYWARTVEAKSSTVPNYPRTCLLRVLSFGGLLVGRH